MVEDGGFGRIHWVLEALEPNWPCSYPLWDQAQPALKTGPGCACTAENREFLLHERLRLQHFVCYRAFADGREGGHLVAVETQTDGGCLDSVSRLPHCSK